MHIVKRCYTNKFDLASLIVIIQFEDDVTKKKKVSCSIYFPKPPKAFLETTWSQGCEKNLIVCTTSTYFYRKYYT